MNNDLISRSELKKAFAEYGEKAKFTQGACKQLIDNAPTVDPEALESVLTSIIEILPEIIPVISGLIPQILEISKIKEITERALRSEDPINLYKARALDDIAEILGIEIKEPEIAKRLVIKQDEDLSNPMMTAYRGYITFYEEG